MDSLRPDIAILRAGKAIGAIEVFVTHTVNDQKALRLQTAAIDWIEVLGHEGIYEEPHAWTIEQSIEPINQFPKPPNWLCPVCQKIERREEFKKNNPSIVRFARMIDIYYRSGKKFRNVLYVKHGFDAEGEKKRVWIEDNDRKVLVSENAPIMDDSQKRMNEAFKEHLHELKKMAQVVDHEMPWTEWKEGKKFVPQDLERFPFRYKWDNNTKKWLIQPQIKWKSFKT